MLGPVTCVQVYYNQVQYTLYDIDFGHWSKFRYFTLWKGVFKIFLGWGCICKPSQSVNNNPITKNTGGYNKCAIRHFNAECSSLFLDTSALL
jgi:hypothetical protein